MYYVYFFHALRFFHRRMIYGPFRLRTKCQMNMFRHNDILWTCLSSKRQNEWASALRILGNVNFSISYTPNSAYTCAHTEKPNETNKWPNATLNRLLSFTLRTLLSSPFSLHSLTCIVCIELVVVCVPASILSLSFHSLYLSILNKTNIHHHPYQTKCHSFHGCGVVLSQTWRTLPVHSHIHTRQKTKICSRDGNSIDDRNEYNRK